MTTEFFKNSDQKSCRPCLLGYLLFDNNSDSLHNFHEVFDKSVTNFILYLNWTSFLNFHYTSNKKHHLSNDSFVIYLMVIMILLTLFRIWGWKITKAECNKSSLKSKVGLETNSETEPELEELKNGNAEIRKGSPIN